MKFSKEEILKAIYDLYESKNINSETVIKTIKKNIIEGKIEESDVKNIINNIHPPLEELNSGGEIISTTYYELFTTDDIKANKIAKANQECNARITAGFMSSCLGEPKMFDCEMTDQATIQGLAITAIMGLQNLTPEETHWKAKGELECYKFEYPQILQLATDMKKHIEDNVNQFNSERLAIKNDTVD